MDLPNEIEDYLIRRNQKHFGQAQASFPTVPPFSEHVDWAASSHESKLILTGDYKDDEYEGMGKIMIEHMQATTRLNAVDDLLREEELVCKLTVWRESTSTSPSGLHLGHHKALIYPFEDDDLDGKQNR